MNSLNPKIQASSRGKIAKMYGVTIPILNKWIELNPELKKICEPYIVANRYTLPPAVVEKIFLILGEP